MDTKKGVSLCYTHKQSTFEIDAEVKKGSAMLQGEQKEVNLGKAKEDGNLIALSSRSPLLFTALMWLYIEDWGWEWGDDTHSVCPLCSLFLPFLLRLSAPQMLLRLM